ncbi:MAG: serine hydrolase [Candidatus Bathyarchaeota archaeon]|nr:serine hydrolase [Candidatus Bathyarchaeota archaeon]
MSDLSERADALFKAYIGRVPGAALTIIKDGQALLKQAYGLANIDSEINVKQETNFRLASLSKAFTATCILKLVEQGKLSLDNSIRSHIPELPPYAGEINLRQILWHVSGLYDYDSANLTGYPEQLHEADVIKLMKTAPPPYFPPGSKYQYSNTGYVLLGVVVERVSGYPFPQFMDREVFQPLGMNNSVLYDAGKNIIRNRAYGYEEKAGKWVMGDQSQTSALFGDGGVYSNIEDLAKWDEALYNDTLFTRETLTDVFTSGKLTDGAAAGYGYGWEILNLGGEKVIYHEGSTSGFKNMYIRIPSRRLSVIFLTNRNDYNLYGLKEIADKTKGITAILHTLGLEN